MATDRTQRMGLIIYRDESFNSITGLNGSGKSNILDSICFVLGITNMSTVRAQNLQVCDLCQSANTGMLIIWY